MAASKKIISSLPPPINNEPSLNGKMLGVKKIGLKKFWGKKIIGEIKNCWVKQIFELIFLCDGEKNIWSEKIIWVI